MAIVAGTNNGHGGYEYHHPGGNSTITDTGISHMSIDAKIAFIVSVVVITLLSFCIACCIMMRKQRSVKPAPSDPPDEEQGRRPSVAVIVP